MMVYHRNSYMYIQYLHSHTAAAQNYVLADSYSGLDRRIKNVWYKTQLNSAQLNSFTGNCSCHIV